MSLKTLFTNIITILFFLVYGCFVQTAKATTPEPVEIKSLESTFNLAIKWKYQQGDDPRWASPDFDDTTWSEIQVDQSPIKQGLNLLIILLGIG